MPAETIAAGGHRVRLSNIDKVLFPESGITKGELVDYYRRIAPTALKLWRGRPLTMRRFPDGIGKEGFYQKNTPAYFPDWIRRAPLQAEAGTVAYVVPDTTATLVYLADQGTIEHHIGLSRTDRVHHPDRMIFDLDPSDGDFRKVQAAARRLKRLLDRLQLASFVQTTGSRGLHVFVPLDRSADFDAVRAFAKAVAVRLADRHPDELTVEHRKRKRGTRVFLDYLRNSYGHTSVAPYSVRARANAPVATPLAWPEALRRDLTPGKYTIRNIFRRLARVEDPWKAMTRKGRAARPAHERLRKLPSEPD